MGKPLHVKQEIVRVWKTGYCRFSDVAVNEHPLINGKTVHLNGFLEHYDSRDLHYWMEKQNVYTSMEALMHIQKEELSVAPKLFGNNLEMRMFF